MYVLYQNKDFEKTCNIGTMGVCLHFKINFVRFVLPHQSHSHITIRIDILKLIEITSTCQFQKFISKSLKILR